MPLTCRQNRNDHTVCPTVWEIGQDNACTIQSPSLNGLRKMRWLKSSRSSEDLHQESLGDVGTDNCSLEPQLSQASLHLAGDLAPPGA